MDDLEIGRTGVMTDAKGDKINFKINRNVEVEEKNHRIPDYPRKQISMQEIVFPDGRKTIRICYYLKLTKGWNYRQEPAFIRKDDLIELIEKAKNEMIL